ncbi:MAG: trypsin-like serine protease [Okeania sp. SIO2C2]|uniref:trypsin-like serine protease n=1 Tax=Okeania sp. SIO2C2 TaxID=2607787 RepID=UPI0013BCAE4D|nr:trypsin-like serine protease [Okeania sp. SIO2C2]NEP91325.1 trypsin-like serine protease [Okeania sp. SIO2C2]
MSIYFSNNFKQQKIFNPSILKSCKNIQISQIALRCVLGLIASQSFQSPVKGIVINDTAGASTAIELGAPFTAVTEILLQLQKGQSRCSGSLIADNYVLTAQHCFDPQIFPEDVSVRFYDENNSLLTDILVSEILFLDGDENFNTFLDGTDIAILELAEAAPTSITPLKLFGFNPEDLIGSEATIAGFGFNGLGSVGHELTRDGLRWGAENVIDLVGSIFIPFFDAVFKSNIINLDFDDGTDDNNTLFSVDSSSSPLTNEGSIGPGDSGSPLLVEVDDELLIAGVLSASSTQSNRFGTVLWFTGVTEHREFIEENGGQFVGDFIPLPPPPIEPQPPVFGIKNGSFENGLNDWSILGAATIVDSDFGIPPSDGESNAFILNDIVAVGNDEIEEFLGLSVGSLEDLSGSIPFEGSAIKQTFLANAGDVLTFDFNFLTDECTLLDVQNGVCEPEDIFNDFSFVSLSGDELDNSFLKILADTSSDVVTSETFFFEETGYQSFSYEISETGTYTLGFGVADADRASGYSGLLVDNVQLTASASTPEPTATLGLFATAFGVFSFRKKRQRN